jgi:hypothetical protein
MLAYERHGCVEPAIVRDVVENHLVDVVDFVGAVRARMSS